MSATSYTLIGVANKFFTVLLAVFFLDRHASWSGIAALSLCIAASTQYQQAPMRKKGQDVLAWQASSGLANDVQAGSTEALLGAAEGDSGGADGGRS